MYYVKKKHDRYDLTTSYANRNQAERYGDEVSFVSELHLQEYDGQRFVEQLDPSPENEYMDLGRVRSVFRSRMDGKEAGRYLVYLETTRENECEEGVTYYDFTGISFQEYGKANQFLKSTHMTYFGEMLIVENPDVPQAQHADGEYYSIDTTNQLSEATREIHDL